jgi:hypothetical protein
MGGVVPAAAAEPTLRCRTVDQQARPARRDGMPGLPKPFYFGGGSAKETPADWAKTRKPGAPPPRYRRARSVAFWKPASKAFGNKTDREFRRVSQPENMQRHVDSGIQPRTGIGRGRGGRMQTAWLYSKYPTCVFTLLAPYKSHGRTNTFQTRQDAIWRLGCLRP